MTAPHLQLAAQLMAEIDGLQAGTMREHIEQALQHLHERGLWHLGPVQRSVAEELWTGLELEEHQQCTEAVLIGKIADFQRGGTALSIGATDGCDWVVQLGILHGALKIIDETPLTNSSE